MEQNLPTTEFSLCASWNKSDVNLNKSVACYSAVLLQLVRETADRRCEVFRDVEKGYSVPPFECSSLARRSSGDAEGQGNKQE
jgi:hypothetical protein